MDISRRALLRLTSVIATVFLLLAGNSFRSQAAPDSLRSIGVAKVDITPDYPVRLSGYGNRRDVHEGVQQHILAKALAIGSDEEGPAILVTVDNCGVPAALRDEVVRRLVAKTKVTDRSFALSSSHTHCAPMLVGVLPNLFSMDIPPEQQAATERYTRELTDKVEQVALAALADRKPAHLSWAVGQVEFAANRRIAYNYRPIDHDLPVLFATDPSGHIRAIFTSYACHCTTLGFNQIHGDWAGCAQEAMERDFPGAIALTALGCGADQNPTPRGTVELAAQHGEALAAEVKRLAAQAKPISAALDCRAKRLDLPFDTPHTRAEWEALAQDKRPAVAYHARRNLARLDRGETLPVSLPYFVQSWSFGDQLGMVFLCGEVVVDYSLRLKQEFDRSRLWVNGYSNDVPCYIPSKRVLDEGGYEGALAMVYYDRPNRFSPAVEDTIVSAVHEVVPKAFVTTQNPAAPAAQLPPQSLRSIQTKPGLKVELVAAEPTVVDPVAIDWGADGRLWVVEMRDYPMGMDGKYKPGGVIKCLQDTHGNGVYDKATVFLDNLPFPTGVMAWGKGILVCAAPDIIYAEDTDGDGRADVVKKLFTGFATDNYQARVNSLAPGLDNWVHGANGLLGGQIHSFASSGEVDIRGRDFRLNPDTGAFEPASGVTQQGRCRDDWDNWFGCSNSRMAYHFAIADHYLRRNPHVAGPSPRVDIPADEDPNLLYPASRPLERFNSPESLNHTTSACGLGLYRDDLLGADFSGDAFTCEPVHNMVHRLKLKPAGVTFEARRAADEQKSEFLASTDNWFRPVQVRTGPDGALWVVDMYRFVIEHPRWIPPDKLAKLDVRAGADMGRIYRVYPEGAKLRPIRDLTKLAIADLVAALDTPNGTTRDMVQLELLRRADPAAVTPLVSLLHSSKIAAARLQALSTLDGLHVLTPALLVSALADEHPAVRRHAIRISEHLFASAQELAAACLKLVSDPDLTVRYQLALSLGEWDDARASEALGVVAKTELNDPWMRTAVLSSCARHPLDVLASVLGSPSSAPGRGELIGGLIATASATAAQTEDLGRLVRIIAPAPGASVEGWQITGLLHLQDALDRRKIKAGDFLTANDPAVRQAAEELKRVYDSTHAMAANDKADGAVRLSALLLFGRGFNDPDRDLSLLAPYLHSAADALLQTAALKTIARSGSARAPEILLADWTKQGPAIRGAILDTLLSREEWIRALLVSVSKGTVRAADVNTATRERLARNANEAIRKEAAQLLPSTRSTNRTAAVVQYQGVANLTGDGVKGAAVYQSICSVCHAYLGQGHAVGPDVTTFRNKSVQDFLIAILDPNAVVEPRYTAYTVQTRDGRTLYGVIASETATTLILAQPGGVRETILRTDIVSLTSAERSLMPEGLEQSITPQQMADLIAYLKGGG
jgi:putative membrane-bound dehydrogenase-like protein